MMSGTSVDGIDVAIADLHTPSPQIAAVGTPLTHEPGHQETTKIEQIFFTTLPWNGEVREQIFAMFQRATPEAPTPVAALCRLNFMVAEEFAKAAQQALSTSRLPTESIDLIASHGQTIWHDVENGKVTSTLQIGDPSVIAARTGITTMGNFRTADVAAGGQGAPLVSLYDWVQLRPAANTSGWRAVQNIGGIGNVTFLPPVGSTAAPLAFDTGPGNVLIDWAAAVATNGQQQYDVDGRLAAAGEPAGALLDAWLQLPYFAQRPPKSTGRELFDSTLIRKWYASAQQQRVDAHDFVATVTELTAASIADAYARFAPGPVTEVIVAGGGARNPVLLRRLRWQLTKRLNRVVPVRTHAELGIDDKAKEALAFALMAHRALHGQAGNVPACTGANKPQILGQIAPGDNYGQLMRKLYSQ